jgi:hypothetical protein
MTIGPGTPRSWVTPRSYITQAIYPNIEDESNLAHYILSWEQIGVRVALGIAPSFQIKSASISTVVSNRFIKAFFPPLLASLIVQGNMTVS